MNELAALERLRAIFLSDAPGRHGDYWQDTATLAAYDRTYARRIAWKWDAVLATAQSRGLELPADKPLTLVDWGCGSGVASRSFLAHFGSGARLSPRVYDRSRAAMQFALDAIAREFPKQPKGSRLDPKEAWPTPYVLLASHVLNEIDEATSEALRAAALKAELVIIVEPGTPAHAARLAAWRQALAADFHFLAPCLHQESCGMKQPERSGDWCHFFAPPPREAFHDPDWAKLAKQLGIDLRSLPVSYLVAIAKRGQIKIPEAASSDQSLVLGRARTYKGYALAQICTPGGIVDSRVQKRSSTQIFKELRDVSFEIRLPADVWTPQPGEKS